MLPCNSHYVSVCTILRVLVPLTRPTTSVSCCQFCYRTHRPRLVLILVLSLMSRSLQELGLGFFRNRNSSLKHPVGGFLLGCKNNCSGLQQFAFEKTIKES